MGQHKNCQHLTMWNSPSKKKKPNGDRLERNLHHSYNQKLKANYTQVHPEMWSVYGCTHFTMPLPRVLYRLCRHKHPEVGSFQGSSLSNTIYDHTLWSVSGCTQCMITYLYIYVPYLLYGLKEKKTLWYDISSHGL